MERNTLFMLSIVICILTLLQGNINAQNTVGGRNAGGVDINAAPGGIVQEIKKEGNSTVGSTYLNEEWTKGSIKLTGGNDLSNQLLRYDVEKGLIELYMSENKVKIINEKFVNSVQIVSNTKLKNDKLLNGNHFFINEVPLTGLVLSEELKGKYNLITKFSVKKTNSSYVKALDAGKYESIISIEKQLYLSLDMKLTEIPRKKKKIIELFKKDADIFIIKTYIKENNLNVNKYEDLVLLVKYINSGMN